VRINYQLRFPRPVAAVLGALVVGTPTSVEAVKDQFRCAAVWRGTEEAAALERAA